MAATVLIFIVGMVVARVSQGQIARRTADTRRLKERVVIVRNAIYACIALAIFAIWASRIAGFALSLAALAGGILIVSKELLTNFLGFAVLSFTQPYRIGDIVEISGIQGRVVDINAISTIVAEAKEGNQFTGRTVSVPNSTLLTQPVRNLTSTGAFVVNILSIKVPLASDVIASQQSLLRVASEVCKEWIEAADAHLNHVEAREMMDLPSARPRVFIEMSDPKAVTLALRYACRPDNRANVEQSIMQQFIEDYCARNRAQPEMMCGVAEEA